jgi:hypothetical protein
MAAAAEPAAVTIEKLRRRVASLLEENESLQSAVELVAQAQKEVTARGARGCAAALLAREFHARSFPHIVFSECGEKARLTHPPCARTRTHTPHAHARRARWWRWRSSATLRCARLPLRRRRATAPRRTPRPRRSPRCTLPRRAPPTRRRPPRRRRRAPPPRWRARKPPKPHSPHCTPPPPPPPTPPTPLPTLLPLLPPLPLPPPRRHPRRPRRRLLGRSLPRWRWAPAWLRRAPLRLRLRTKRNVWRRCPRHWTTCARWWARSQRSWRRRATRRRRSTRGACVRPLCVTRTPVLGFVYVSVR